MKRTFLLVFTPVLIWLSAVPSASAVPMYPGHPLHPSKTFGGQSNQSGEAPGLGTIALAIVLCGGGLITFCVLLTRGDSGSK
jgi:hypothetical protein